MSTDQDTNLRSTS